jgi:hypothetical protein
VNDQDVAVRLSRDGTADTHPQSPLEQWSLVRPENDQVGVDLVRHLEDHLGGIAMRRLEGRSDSFVREKRLRVL